MGVYVTDGNTLIDISESHYEKSDLPRYANIKAIQDKDIVQTFGTLGRSIIIDGVWDLADGVNDGRNSLEFWRSNNILVLFDDTTITGIQGFGTRGWYTIHDFSWDIKRGRSQIIVNYHLELQESLRITLDDSTSLPSGQFVPATLTPTPLASGAVAFSHNKHTFVDQKSNWWIMSVQSTGTAPTRFSFSVTSAGEEFTWIQDFVANPSRGSSVRFLSGDNSVNIAWTDEHTLKFVKGTVNYVGGASPTIAFGSVVAVDSVLTANEGNFKPDICITSTPRYYISTCSGNKGFQVYDSNDGVTWNRPWNFTESLVTDPNRYSSIIVTTNKVGATTTYFKRVFFVDKYNGVANATNSIWTHARNGTSESSYTGTEHADSPTLSTLNLPAYDQTYKTGQFALAVLPLASYGSVINVGWDGTSKWELEAWIIDEYNAPQNWQNLSGTVGNQKGLFSPIDPGLIGFNASAGLFIVPQFVTAGLSTTEDNVNIFFLKDGVPWFMRVKNLFKDITTVQATVVAAKSTFGTTSVGQIAYLNTPDISTLTQSFAVWQSQLGNATGRQTVFGGVP